MVSVQVVGVSVDHNDRVIDDHSEYEDERRQGDGIQFDAGDIHQGNTYRGAYRQTGSCHEGGTQGEEH